MIIGTAVISLKTQTLPPSLVPIMRFSILTAVAALSSGALAALRATEVVRLLDDLRRESSPLVRTSTLLDLENSRLLIRLRGPWSVSPRPRPPPPPPKQLLSLSLSIPIPSTD